MNLSLNWLKEFVEIPKNIKASDLRTSLTMHTVEVEEIREESEKFNNLVVGKVLEVKKHPNADRLQVALVDNGSEKLNIVCGAPNIAPGQRVPVALVGSILPNGLEIKEADVRGEISKGMLCAPDELGVGGDHSGILILDKNAKVGKPLAEHFKMEDTIIEVDNKSLSNRPDLWGHIGMAREISAIHDLKFLPAGRHGKNYQYNPDKLSCADCDKLSIKVEDHKDCSRYMAISMKGIKIVDSPKWMQDRLLAVGMRPINNIVDITNYIMLEIGQPMHAFDRNLVDKIVVRKAKKGETMDTLDGEARELDEDMIVIADSKKPLALAGVMGGANSEISNETQEIIFESANFDFVSVRKTSNKLSLRTDSSSRFEKGLDPNMCEKALVRAVELVTEIIPGAEISSQLSDEKKFELNLGPIEIEIDWFAKILGVKIEKKKILASLASLGFIVEDMDKKINVTIPTWRATKDISTKEDVAEEVARIFGYDNIPSLMPSLLMEAPELNNELSLIRRIRETLKGLSLSEVYNYSFVDEAQLKKMGVDSSQYFKLANPLTANQTLLRQKLSTNLILNVKTNQARFEDFAIFEIGNVFLSHAGSFGKDKKSDEKLPYQENRLGMLFASDKEDGLFRKAKGSIEALFASLGLKLAFCEADSQSNWAQKTNSSDVYLAGQRGTKTDIFLGTISMMDGKISRSLGIKKQFVIAEFFMSEILKTSVEREEKTYKPIPKYPALLRDLAFVVNKKISYSDIVSSIYKHSEYIESIELFDVYVGENIGGDNKNIAFRVRYQADKTLTNEEVDDIQKELLNKMGEKFEAVIRDY
ncbi:MAG: phenylalanine--tRNA ligase subunit beta [Patescibacteria group bacterium]|jgi:phenylalanyl-tRNA synthetase beta chain|nr:phenylalanine--tRNA ligase subunit beta [Patescibacteria group bacterium]